MIEKVVQTSHGDVALSETVGKGSPVLFIHGNSLSREVFENQLESEIGLKFRCIAIDLPGHGASKNALNPDKTYTIPGYADVVIEVMQIINIDNFAVFGWSLGGHIAIEILGRSANITGLCLCGTPPLSKNPADRASAFLANSSMQYMGKKELNDQQIAVCFEAIFGADQTIDPASLRAFHRADGVARENVANTGMGGNCMDHRKLLAETSIPVAIINGEKDSVVNNVFIHSLKYGSLWENRMHVIPSEGHAPFMSSPISFNKLLIRFLSSLHVP